MEDLIYNVKIDGIILKLEENSLGFCLSINYGTHTDVFIYSNINTSLDKMHDFLNCLELTF